MWAAAGATPSTHGLLTPIQSGSVMDLAIEATAAAETGAAFVVITGGEPLHHNLDALTAAIRTSCEVSPCILKPVVSTN